MARLESDVLLGGRYRLLRPIASGGMGAVWEAEDTVLHRRVAVKVLSESLSSDEHFIERFRREARAAAALSHPSVAGVFDYGVDGDTHFIVMELISGETLAARLARGPLPWEEAVQIAERVAGALQHAHRAGGIHRDVKPGNIMLTPDGGVKVMDFGIASAASATPITGSGTAMGTATYISPEQAAGHRATPASDVYSLGVVLYEMLAGRPPFSGSSPVAVATAHVHDEPPPLRTLAPDAPAHVVATCELALSKDPGKRPPSAMAFAEMLRSPGAVPPSPDEPAQGEPTAKITLPPTTAVFPGVVEAGTPPLGLTVTEPPPRSVGPPHRPPRRRRGAFLLLLAALVIALVALAVSVGGNAPTPGGPVSPTPSTSQGTIPVPGVIGMKEGDAKSALEAAGLTVGNVVQVAGPDGIVINSTPLPDQLVSPGTPVTLYVGSTPTSPAPKPSKSHGHGKGKGGGG
jgi:eukaryotic-like serine/threonine-protein kinase